jgi:hypothetical protein
MLLQFLPEDYRLNVERMKKKRKKKKIITFSN